MLGSLVIENMQTSFTMMDTGESDVGESSVTNSPEAEDAPQPSGMKFRVKRSRPYYVSPRRRSFAQDFGSLGLDCPITLFSNPIVSTFLHQHTFGQIDDYTEQMLQDRLACYSNHDPDTFRLPPTSTSDNEIDLEMDDDDDQLLPSNRVLEENAASGDNLPLINLLELGTGNRSTQSPSSPNSDTSPAIPRLIAPDGAPPLTDEMLELNQSKLKAESFDDLKIVRIVRTNEGKTPDECTVKQEDLAVLAGSNLLTDPVVDYYLALIHRRNMHGSGLKIYPFRCTFYSLLGSSKWMEKIENATDDIIIFQFDLAFFPVCVSDHWRLIVADFRNRTISSYNSLMKCTKGEDVQIMKNITKFLRFEYKSIYSVTDPGKWRFKSIDEPPQQKNVHDCGAFMLAFAEQLSRGVTRFEFGQQHIPYFREKMIFETTHSTLL